MTSIHTWKSIALAQKLGAASGLEENRNLWDLSKRELIEIALHLGALCHDGGSYDEAIAGPGAYERVIQEQKALSNAGLI